MRSLTVLVADDTEDTLPEEVVWPLRDRPLMALDGYKLEREKMSHIIMAHLMDVEDKDEKIASLVKFLTFKEIYSMFYCFTFRAGNRLTASRSVALPQCSSSSKSDKSRNLQRKFSSRGNKINCIFFCNIK